jgi:alpha-tubulin suppressor-like RCC1 family protein
VVLAAFTAILINAPWVKRDALLAWGDNQFGQLGNGTSGVYIGSTVPAPVNGLSSDVTAVAGGYFHSLAIQNAGVYGHRAITAMANQATACIRIAMCLYR